MHNLSNRRLFSKDVRLKLDNLWLIDSADTGKQKFGSYCAEQQINVFFLGIRLRMNTRKTIFFLTHIFLHSD